MQFPPFHAARYTPDLAGEWDRLTETAAGGTVMQSRRFLDYHGPRFDDLSLVGRRTGQGPLTAVFPLARDPSDATRAVSHPGTSFGGLILADRDPAHHRAFLRGAAGWLQGQGLTRLLLRLPPAAVLRQPDDALMPDLIRLCRVVQLDLWSVLPLTGAPSRAYWQSEIRRGQRKGLHAQPVTTAQDWADLHSVITARITEKYGCRLVHSLPELIDLHARLGRQSRAHLIRDASGQVLDGQWFIDYGTGTLHNQYNGASAEGLTQGAASFGIALTLEQALTDGFTLFSFGRSTLDDGFTENRALLRFKSGFGAGLASQFHIELDLDALVTLRP